MLDGDELGFVTTMHARWSVADDIRTQIDRVHEDLAVSRATEVLLLNEFPWNASSEADAFAARRVLRDDERKSVTLKHALARVAAGPRVAMTPAFVELATSRESKQPFPCRFPSVEASQSDSSTHRRVLDETLRVLDGEQRVQWNDDRVPGDDEGLGFQRWRRHVRSRAALGRVRRDDGPRAQTRGSRAGA